MHATVRFRSLWRPCIYKTCHCQRRTSVSYTQTALTSYGNSASWVSQSKRRFREFARARPVRAGLRQSRTPIERGQKLDQGSLFLRGQRRHFNIGVVASRLRQIFGAQPTQFCKKVFSFAAPAEATPGCSLTPNMRVTEEILVAEAQLPLC